MLAYGCLRTYTEGERSYGCCWDDTFASKEEAPQTMNPLRKVFKECQIFPPLSPPLKAALCTQRTMGHHCSAAPNQAMFWGMKCWEKKGDRGPGGSTLWMHSTRYFVLELVRPVHMEFCERVMIRDF